MTHPNYYETLPKKRMAAGALFLNENGNILIVKPTYRPYWLLPGGSIEENESPTGGCIREVKEELDIDAISIKLVGIDYLSQENEQTEHIQFAFYCGVLSNTQIHAIKLPPTELHDYQFLSLEEVLPILSPKLARGLPYYLNAIKKNTIVYLENGEEI